VPLFVSAAGDVRTGDEVVAGRRQLGDAQIGALAEDGLAGLAALVAPASRCSRGVESRRGRVLLSGVRQIYESNGLMLAAADRAVGADIGAAETSCDEESALGRRLRARSRRTFLVTSGGVSVGDATISAAGRAEIGVEEVFLARCDQAGEDDLVRRPRRALVFGLPGNPVSSLVGCERFVKRRSRACRASKTRCRAWKRGVLAAALRRRRPRRFVRRGHAWTRRVVSTALGQELSQ